MTTSLVTGAAGFVGQHLVRELLRSGRRVVGGTLDGRAPHAGVLTPEERAQVGWRAADITSLDDLARLIGDTRPSEIYHLAAQSSVGASFDDVLGTWETNASGTLRLLHVAGELLGREARVLFVSSSEVYGVVAPEEQPLSEDRVLKPANPYAASKAAAEMAARLASASGELRVVIARSFNHTGPGQSNRFALPSWAEQLVTIAQNRGDPVLKVGNLEARRDLLDVRDVVRAYRILAERGKNGEAYNVCCGEAHRLHDLVEQLILLSGTGATIQVDPERFRPLDLPLLMGDPGRIRRLGWEPEIALSQTLQDLLDWARNEAAA